MNAKTISGFPKIISVAILILIGVTTVQSQLLFEENFDYPIGDNLTDHNWTRHSGTTNPITVTSPGLIYTNYPSISGNAALLDNDGEDVSQNFTEQTSGTIYVSFLVNVSNAPTDGYFLHLGPTSMGTQFYGRVWVKEEDDDIEFGIAKKTSSPTYTDNNYSKNTIYLLVLKYEFIDGSDNDEASLFVFTDPDLPGSEPSTPTIIPDNSESDPTNLGTIALRQFDSNQDIIVDGIRIGLSWSDAPIPVELTAFTATISNGAVILNWTTQTETENYGFHVYRSLFEDRDYVKITQTIIPGAGSSEVIHYYSYTDATVEPSKTYYYKLAALDYNGNVDFHGPISAVVTGVRSIANQNHPEDYALEQNYPNPFNPETAINFSIKEAGKVSLKIYNLQGQVVRTLVDEEKPAGSYSVMWNGMAENGARLMSGVYYYILKVNGFEEMKKLTFIK